MGSAIGITALPDSDFGSCDSVTAVESGGISGLRFQMRRSRDPSVESRNRSRLFLRVIIIHGLDRTQAGSVHAFIH